jgi:hypothetical protein
MRRIAQKVPEAAPMEVRKRRRMLCSTCSVPRQPTVLALLGLRVEQCENLGALLQSGVEDR